MYRSGTETKSRLRPRHFLAVTLLLSLGGALSISAAPSDASTPEVLKYIPGKTYQYRFESKSLTELTGTTAETSAVELNGDVALAVTNADFVLTLQNFKLVSPSGKVVQRLAELDGSSVRFSYSNGRISEFKVNENDPTWSANIKRAVASLFVNYAVVTPDIPRVQYLEDDVSGFNCPTDYVTSANGQFKKTRDLNRCSGRDGGFSTQFGVPFTSATSQTDTDIQSDATVDSDQTCNQAFDNGILKTTQCTETHRVTLLNNGDSGAKATVSSSLTFSRVQDGTPTASASTATHACTIRFVHTSSGLSRTNKALRTAEQLLQTLCTDVADGVLGDETAETYMSLKKNLKDVNEDGLQSLSGKVCNEKARKLFYDAVASTATPDSISFLVKLIREGKVSKGTERVFRIYTTFADKPTEKALLSLKSLIENKDVDPKFFFTASGLARQFYRKNRKTAASNAAYVGIANELAKRVQDNFQSANEDSQAVAVSALQALGNFEFLPANAVSAIQSAITGNSRRIKVHALQAFRSDVCQASLRSKARGILQDKTVSSDLRIHAYLAYDKCATAESDAGFYNDLVREEDSLQVLAFLKSHLSNKPDPIIITKASNPLLAKTLSDARKFSQNVPYSIVDSDTTGIGYSTEANVIYAADSFLPKTVSANFTVDLYGESYNLLEVGLNLGDFDNVFEKLFGPKGEFPTYYDEKRKRGRGRRAIAPEIKQNELDVFYGQVKIDETSERDDVYVRVFGTTIAAKSFDLEDFLVEDGRYNFGDSIVNAVKGSADIDFTEPFPVFADELIIPTVSGLPLTIRADATALLALQVKNELTEDLKTYKPRIAPSASIKSKLSLTIGSEFFEAGFGVDTQVHSALDISAHGVLDSAQQGKFNYDLSISIPQEKLHLLDISNEIYWLEEFASEGPASKKAIVPSNPQKVTADNRCSQRLESYFGLKVCHTSKIPTGKDLPDFPINGPLDYSLTLANAEGSKDYKANLKFQLDRSGPYSFLVKVDTPGSSVNRKVEIKGVYQSSYGDKDISKLSVNFDSPVKKAYLSCDYENDFKDKKGAHTLKVGVDAREYSLATKWTSVGQTTKVNSVLSLPGQNPVEILNVEATQKKEGPTTSATWNVVAGPSNKPYVATSGTIGSTLRQDSNTPELSFNEVQLTCTGKRIFLLNGRVHDQLVDLDTKFLVGESEHDVKVNGELDIPEPGRIVFKGTVSSASLPFLNGALNLDRTSRNDHRKTSLQVNRDGVKLVNYEFLHKDQQYSEDVFVATPDGTTYEFKFDRVLEPEQYSLTYSLNLAKKVASNAEIKFNRKDHTYKLNGALTVPGTEIKLNSERAKSSKSGEPVESFVHGLALQPGPSFKLDTKVYVDRAKGGIWKRRVSIISSSLLDADRTLTINYDVSSENENRPKLTRDGSGTVELLVKKGQGDKAKFSLTTRIPKGPRDDGLAKLQVFLSGVVDSELTLNIAPGKKNVFDLNGDIEVYGAGTTASIKTSLVTDYHLSRDPVKSAQFMVELKCNDGKPSFKSFTYASDLKYQNDAQRFTYDLTRKITLTGSTYQIDTKVNVEKSPMGVHTVSLHILYPNQEKYNFDLQANTQSDPRTKFGHFELDIQLHKEPKSTLIFEAGLKNLNLNRNEFQFLINYKLVREGVNSPKTKKGNHYPALEFVVDSQPRNGKHAVNINYSEGGVYAVTPIHYDIKAELGGGEYNLNYRGGQDDAPDTLLDVGVKKSVNELTTYTFTYVFDKSVVEGQDPDVKATWGYSYRYNSLTDFEYKESFDAQTYNAVAPENNSKATVARSMKVGANGIDFTSHMVLSKGNTAPSKDHDLKFSLNREDKKVTGSFELHDKGIGYLTKNPGQTDVSLSFEVSRDFPNLHLTVTGKFPRYDNIKLKIDHENVNNGQVRNTTVDAKVGDFQLGFVSNLENSADRKTLDWTLNLNNDPPKKLTLVYTDAAKGPSIEAFVQWDNGQVLSSTGALEKLANGFNANFNFDSPTLANKWKLAVSRQADAQKESFRISAESPDTQEVLSVSYDKKASKKSGKLSLNANGKVKLNLRQKKVNANGGLEFLLDKQFYDEGRTTKGQRVKLQVAFQTDKRSGNLSLEAGQGDSAKQLNLQACSLPEDCVQLKAQLSQEKGKESYVGSVARGDDGAGVSLEVSTSDDSQTRSRSIRVYRTQDGRTRDAKIKLFKQPGEVADLDLVKDVVKVTPSTIAKRGLEVEMFGTTLTAIGTLATWESVDGYSLEGSCWLDKANQPTKKFALGFSKVGASVNEQGQGQDLTIAARHYLLQRDLKATVHYRYGITNKVFELASEVDIFKQEQDKLVLSAELNQNRGSSGSPLFGIDLSAKSAGQGIVLSTSCNNIKVEESGVSFTCQVVGKASGTERKFIVDYDRTKETRTIEIKNNERYFFYNRSLTYEKTLDSLNPNAAYYSPTLNIEVQLPGMPDPRIITYRAVGVPLTVSLKTNPSASNLNEFSELWLGTTGTNAFGFGLIRNSDSGRLSLVDVQLAKLKKQLSVTVDWNKENIIQFLHDRVSILNKNQDNLVKFVNEAFASAEDTSNAICDSFSKASQDFGPVKERFNNIVGSVGLGSSPVVGTNTDIVQTIATKVSVLAALRKAALAGIEGGYGGANTLASTVEGVVNQLSSVQSFPRADSTAKRVAAFRDTVQTIVKAIRQLVAQTKPLKEKYPLIQKLATKIRQTIVDKVKKAYKSAKNDLNELFPYTEVKKFLEDFVDYFETALLRPEEVTPAQKAQITGEMDKAVEQILVQAFAADFTKGHAVINVPLVYRAKLFKFDQDSDDPITEFLEKLSKSPRDALPPVDATGLILGTGHFVTFDGKMGRFDKTCNYLLASDFVGRNFSVALDLGSDGASSGSESLSVTDGKNTISLAFGKVYVDKKQYETYTVPTRVGSFRISQEAGWLIVSGDAGVKVGCQIHKAWEQDHMCAVQISGFYHGKVEGVLGHYDNEPKDDYKLPTGQITDYNALFVKSWKLNQECQGKNNWKDISEYYDNLYDKEELDFDTFFSKSSRSPHRKFSSSEGLYASASVTSGVSSVLTAMLLLISLLFGYLD